MRWRLARYKKFDKAAVAALFITLFPIDAQSLDDDALWLPTKYSKYYLDLKKAALAAEKLDRCVTVLRGTLDLEQTRKERPIYRILCRKENGRNYNEMVDGVTFETLTTKIPKPEEILAQKLAEEQKRKEKHWQLCQESLNEKVRLMKNVEILTTEMPEPEVFEETKSQFTLDFNGENMQGVALHYRANCIVDTESNMAKVKVGRRK